VFNEFGDTTFELAATCSSVRNQGVFVTAEQSKVRIRVVE
jgi:hypothetical protein